jgi:adenylate cyclase
LALPDNPSIAVLPFKNMSEDPTQEYFSDGFTDTLITDLSQLRQLVVIARNSTFTYKGKAVDVRQVGQELGVRYILEGSVQRADGRVRINAQLVDAGTGKHLWATRFDRPFDDIFAVQDTITRKIVAALDVELVEGEQARVWRRTTENPEAYDVFLRGREHHQRFTKQDTARARELYTHALTLDPKFAAAMAMLGWIYNLDADFWGVAPEESRDKMRGAAESAIALDDALGEGYSVLAFYYYRHAGDAARAIANAERALTLSPSSAHHHHIAALVLSKMGGQPARGLALIQKAFRLNPFPPPLYLGTLGEIYFDLGRYDEAIDVFQTTLRRLPDFLPAYVNLTATYRAVGREAEARVHAQKVLQINPHFSVNRWTAHFHPSVKESFQGLLLQAGLPE